MTRVYLAGDDITERVGPVPFVVESAAPPGQLVVNDISELVGLNYGGFWSQLDAASPFRMVPGIEGIPVRIDRDGGTIYDGGIYQIDVPSPGTTAVVRLRSAVQAAIEGHPLFASRRDDEDAVLRRDTPASVARELAATLGLTINEDSFSRAHGIYDSNALYVSCFSTGQATGADLLQQLATVGIASLYVVNGVLYWMVYEIPTSEPVVTFTDRPITDVSTWPIIGPYVGISAVQTDRNLGWVVEWVGGTASNGESDSARRVSAGPDALVRVESLNGATWIGETWQAVALARQLRLELMIPPVVGRDLHPGYPVLVDFAAWGEPVIMDVLSVDRTNLAGTLIAGFTRGVVPS